MSAFKIKKLQLIGLASWLNELSLSGKESRDRSKFVSQLSDGIKEMEEDRLEIVKRHCDKDEDGKLKVKEEDGKSSYDIASDKMPAFESEYSDLLNEEFVIDILEANKPRFLTIKEIVLDTDYKFGPKENDDDDERVAKIRQAADYVVWCDAFMEVIL